MTQENTLQNEQENAPVARVIALSELHANAEAGARLVENANPLYMVKARLQVCVGEATISVGELLAVREHQVLKLDRMLEQPIDLLLEGTVVARGQLIAVDDHFAVRIVELPLPLRLLAKNSGSE